MNPLVPWNLVTRKRFELPPNYMSQADNFTEATASPVLNPFLLKVVVNSCILT